MAGTGWLHGWRLTFGGEDIGWEGALATVVEDPDSKVFVVLYDMTPADEKNLDRWEGSEFGVHKKIRCRVERISSDTTTDPVLAWLYVLDAWEGGLPSARYLGVMADAAEIAGAPERLRARPAHPPGPQHRPGDRRLGRGKGKSQRPAGPRIYDPRRPWCSNRPRYLAAVDSGKSQESFDTPSWSSTSSPVLAAEPIRPLPQAGVAIPQEAPKRRPDIAQSHAHSAGVRAASI